MVIYLKVEMTKDATIPNLSKIQKALQKSGFKATVGFWAATGQDLGIRIER